MTALGRGTACARAGLVGNPSDMHGGAVLAVPVPSLVATVSVGSAKASGSGSGGVVDDPLLLAGLTVWQRRFGPLPPDASRLQWETTIPRSVGLGGSSALVIAMLRALSAWQGIDLAPLDLAGLALAAERDELGIAAGWQDRVVQSFAAPVLVDGGDHSSPPSVRVLGPSPLKVFVAWDEVGGAAPSGEVHASLAARLASGDTDAVETMAALASVARAAAPAFGHGDLDAVAEAVDTTCGLRSRIGSLTASTAMLVERARAVGGHATSAGSGGAIAGVAADPRTVVEVLKAGGHQAIVVG